MINLLADILSVLVVCSFLIIIIIRNIIRKNSKIKELKLILDLKREECINLRRTIATKNKKRTTLYKITILHGDGYQKYETFSSIKSMHFNHNNGMCILEGLDKTKYIKTDTIVLIDKEVQND